MTAATSSRSNRRSSAGVRTSFWRPWAYGSPASLVSVSPRASIKSSTRARCALSSRASRAICAGRPGRSGYAWSMERALAAAFFSQWAWSTSTASKCSSASGSQRGSVARWRMTGPSPERGRREGVGRLMEGADRTASVPGAASYSTSTRRHVRPAR